MRTIILFLRHFLTGFSVLAFALGSHSYAQQIPQLIRGTDFSSVAERMHSASNGDLKLVRLSLPGIPGLAIANTEISSPLLSQASRADQTAVALAAKVWLGMTAQNMLGISEKAELVQSATERTGDIWLSSFQLSFSGIAVRERFLHLNIGALNGRVMMLRNNLPITEPNNLTPTITTDEVLRKVRDNLGSGSIINNAPHLVLVDSREKTLQLCYEATVGNASKNELWRMTYDATTGDLIEKKNLLHDGCFRGHGTDDKSEPISARQYDNPAEKHSEPLAGVSGRITALVKLRTPFDTSVIVGLANTYVTVNGIATLTDSSGYWSTAGVYPAIIHTSFVGKYHYATRMDSANDEINQTFFSGPANIEWNDSNSDESERDAYYSVDFAHTHARKVDKKLGRLDTAVEVRVNYDASCNAFYNPQNISLTFFKAGGGCTNTAQIADVAYHEYGHRINHARYSQASGIDTNLVDGSLGEGFADLNSSFLRDDPRIGVTFFGKNTRLLRNCENTNRFPDNIDVDIHINGMIISGAFWDLRKTMGLKETEKLFHTMCYQRPDGPGGTDPASLQEAFTSTLMATLITDDDDNNLANGTPHAAQIVDAFDKHNIGLTGLIDLAPDRIADQDTATANYPISVIAKYNGAIGDIDQSTMTVHYKLAKEKSYHDIPLAHDHDSVYSGTIPKLPAGSIVDYYVSAGTTFSSTNVKTEPLPVSPLVFLIGFTRKILEDGESNTGWQTGTPSDSAFSGQWVRGKPIGTFYPQDQTFFVQQDTDHTLSGTQCFVTGNKNTTAPSSDDVDRGVTTLVSPAYDLSKLNDPVIRYWYYYSNNTGKNPGLPQWIVKLSTNGGLSWKTIQQTTQSTNGWTPYVYRIRDYAAPTATVKLEFLASDNIQALVEAGVDDLEILDASEVSNIGVRSDISEKLTLSISSQPIVRSSSATVRFTLPQSLHIDIVLEDLLGNVVQNIGKGIYSGGEHSLAFTPSQNLASGIYIIEMRTSQGVKRIKVAIL